MSFTPKPVPNLHVSSSSPPPPWSSHHHLPHDGRRWPPPALPASALALSALSLPAERSPVQPRPASSPATSLHPQGKPQLPTLVDELSAYPGLCLRLWTHRPAHRLLSAPQPPTGLPSVSLCQPFNQLLPDLRLDVNSTQKTSVAHHQSLSHCLFFHLLYFLEHSMRFPVIQDAMYRKKKEGFFFSVSFLEPSQLSLRTTMGPTF